MFYIATILITQDNAHIATGAMVVVEAGVEELEPVIKADGEVGVDGVTQTAADGGQRGFVGFSGQQRVIMPGAVIPEAEELQLILVGGTPA